MSERRTRRRIQTLSVYIGDGELRRRRVAALDVLAQSHGLSGRSQLIQAIADGRLAVTTDTPCQPPRDAR